MENDNPLDDLDIKTGDIKAEWSYIYYNLY